MKQTKTNNSSMLRFITGNPSKTDNYQATNIKNIFRPRRVSNTLKDALNRLSKDRHSDKSPSNISIEHSPQKQATEINGSQRLSLAKVGVSSLSKMHSKHSIFQLPVVNKLDTISPSMTNRYMYTRNHQILSRNTYYLKTQTKNPLNTRSTADKAYNTPYSYRSSNHAIFDRHSSRATANTQVSTVVDVNTKSNQNSIGYRHATINDDNSHINDTFKQRRLRMYAQNKYDSNMQSRRDAV